MKTMFVICNKYFIIFRCTKTKFQTLLFTFLQATLAFDWDLNDDLKDEVGTDIRPDFEAKCKKKRKNPVTGLEEPYFPTYARFPM